MPQSGAQYPRGVVVTEHELAAVLLDNKRVLRELFNHLQVVVIIDSDGYAIPALDCLSFACSKGGPVLLSEMQALLDSIDRPVTKDLAEMQKLWD